MWSVAGIVANVQLRENVYFLLPLYSLTVAERVSNQAQYNQTRLHCQFFLVAVWKF